MDGFKLILPRICGGCGRSIQTVLDESPDMRLCRSCYQGRGMVLNYEVGDTLVDPQYHQRITTWLNQYVDKIGRITREYMEAMTAAYFAQTQIPPDEAELVHESSHTDKGYRDVWYFRRRGEG